jgi:hypothetical protein
MLAVNFKRLGATGKALLMIFNKILGSSDLAFDLSLDKAEYRPGEKVKGTLSLKTQKTVKARQLILYAQGKESTIITVSETNDTYSSSSSSSRHRGRRTYSEVNTFFSQDLSYVLQNSISHTRLEDGTLEILPQNKDLEFNFNLPSSNSLFSSYKGKHANITYTIKATADIANKLDVNEEQIFSIFNPNNNKVIIDDITSSREDNSYDFIDTSAFEKQNNARAASSRKEETNVGEKGSDKESYSDRFERIFGEKGDDHDALPARRQRPRYYTTRGATINIDLGTIFAKDREHYLKDNPDAKIIFLNQEKTNSSYSPGDKIIGEIKLLLPPNLEEIRQENRKNKKIRSMKITLTGIENAFAQGLQRTTTIEKYEEDVKTESLFADQNVGKNDIRIPFEFQIPEVINQSYTGKYSDYFWGLEAKLNIAWSSDITARTMIEIAG